MGRLLLKLIKERGLANYYYKPGADCVRLLYLLLILTELYLACMTKKRVNGKQRKLTGIWAVVPAAGKSVRMGTPKMLLPFKGSTIIEQVIKNLLDSDVDRIVVVTGAYRDEIMKVTRRYDVFHCYNEDYHKGMLSSLKCGFYSVPDGCSGVLILPGDQPMTGSVEINRVIEAYLSSEKGLAVATYGERRGHPLIVDLKYSDEVLDLPDEKGLRELVQRHPDDLLEVKAGDSAVLRDIDTPDDYMNEIGKS